MTTRSGRRRAQFLSSYGGMVLLVTVVAAASQACRLCDRFCPKQPPANPTVQAELIIDDEHAAVWSHLENDFASDMAGWQRLAGVLIQIGTFYSDHDFSGRHSWFSTIEFWNAAGDSETLKEGDFDWINVASAGRAASSTLTSLHAEHLFPTRAPNCKPLDDCFVTGPPPHAKPYGCSMQAWNLIDGNHLQPCLRHESLHSHFVPFGVLTYWQGEDGYTLAAGNRGRIGTNDCKGTEAHNCFSFQFANKIDLVDVYLGGNINAAVDQRVDALGNITRIIIHHPNSPTVSTTSGDVNHGGMHKPGTDN